jgi:hypothetical protein
VVLLEDIQSAEMTREVEDMHQHNIYHGQTWILNDIWVLPNPIIQFIPNVYRDSKGVTLSTKSPASSLGELDSTDPRVRA